MTKQTHFICLFVLCLFIPYPHGYKVSRGVPDYCAFDQTNAFNLFVCLMLVCSFSPRVHSIPRGPHILKKRIRMMCCFCCMPDKNRRFYDIGTPNNAKKKAYRAASLFVVWNCGNVISSFRLFRESRCSPYSSSWGRSRRSYRLSARFACSRVVRDP